MHKLDSSTTISSTHNLNVKGIQDQYLQHHASRDTKGTTGPNASLTPGDYTGSIDLSSKPNQAGDKDKDKEAITTSDIGVDELEKLLRHTASLFEAPSLPEPVEPVATVM